MARCTRGVSADSRNSGIAAASPKEEQPATASRQDDARRPAVVRLPFSMESLSGGRNEAKRAGVVAANS